MHFGLNLSNFSFSVKSEPELYLNSIWTSPSTTKIKPRPAEQYKLLFLFPENNACIDFKHSISKLNNDLNCHTIYLPLKRYDAAQKGREREAIVKKIRSAT